MGNYEDKIRNAEDLSAVARGAADAVELADALTPFLPSREDVTLDYDLDADTLGLPRAASFRAYDATAPYGKEKSVGSRKGSLPASSIKLRIGELDQLLFRGASDEALGDAYERKARQNGQSVAIRAIFARGAAIADGKVDLQAENGLSVSIDFGRPTGNSIVAQTPWTNPAADAIADIIALQAYFDGVNGGQAGGVILSTAVLQALSTNTSFITAFRGTSSSGLTRIGQADVLSVLSDYNVREITRYDKQYEDMFGVTRRVIPQDRFILVPSQDDVVIGDGGVLGETIWGAPAESFKEKYGIPESDRAGIFAAAFDGSDPEGIDILASAIFLPVPSTAGVKKTVSLDVL
ncbi:major capsid protein [Glaciihabitans sp. dw_435]|uniref:major capsid protein n=1 Tax=Glaciihabitans sp. dw_435 TaxID=2720081 RepID=UPI001BD262BC|nr:major capsid protein [Glaciihabitans sp. dw_435]